MNKICKICKSTLLNERWPFCFKTCGKEAKKRNRHWTHQVKTDNKNSKKVYFLMKRIIYKVLAVVSFGFYVHPCAALECPGHPKDAEEIQRENDDYQNKEKKEILDNIDPEGAPHSTDGG